MRFLRDARLVLPAMITIERTFGEQIDSAALGVRRRLHAIGNAASAEPSFDVQAMLVATVHWNLRGHRNGVPGIERVGWSLCRQRLQMFQRRRSDARTLQVRGVLGPLHF